MGSTGKVEESEFYSSGFFVGGTLSFSRFKMSIKVKVTVIH